MSHTLALQTNADGLIYLPQFGTRLLTRDAAIDEAATLADRNEAPVGVWERDGWYTVCEHAPESITPDPSLSGWEVVAVLDPMSWVEAS